MQASDLKNIFLKYISKKELVYRNKYTSHILLISTGKTAQHSVLAALPEEPRLILYTHTVGHSFM